MSAAIIPTTAASVTLYLMTEKGYRVLLHITQHLDKSVVKYVVSAQDKNLANDYFVEIQSLCAREGIPFYNRLGAPTLNSVFTLAISWRWLIQNANSLIVLHDSLLPRYRGFAPLVNCLIRGESEIGVTALYASAEFDRGDIIAQASRAVCYPMTIAQAIELSIGCYTDIVDRLWPNLRAGLPLPAEPQHDDQATYSLWRDEEDYRIDWNCDSIYLKRFIDALGWPYKGAATLMNDQLLRVTGAQVEPDVFIENRTCGKVLFVLNQQPVVVCGTGLLKITALQHENGNSVLPLKQFRVRFR